MKVTTKKYENINYQKNLNLRQNTNNTRPNKDINSNQNGIYSKPNARNTYKTNQTSNKPYISSNYNSTNSNNKNFNQSQNKAPEIIQYRKRDSKFVENKNNIRANNENVINISINKKNKLPLTNIGKNNNQAINNINNQNRTNNFNYINNQNKIISLNNNNINNSNNKNNEYKTKNNQRNNLKSESIDKRILFNKLNSKKINDSIIKDEKEEKKEDIISENYLCFQCQEKAFIDLNFNTLSVKMKCENGHEKDNIPIKEFKKKNELKKRETCYKCRNEKLKLNQLLYCSCKKIICEKCKQRYHSNHFQIKFLDKHYYCIEHKQKYTCFCKKCNKNICNNCLKDHNQHNKELLYFDNVLPKDREIQTCRKDLEKFKQKKKDMDDKFNKFIEKLKEKKETFVQNFELYMQLLESLFNKMNNKESIIYEDIYNFKNLKNNLNVKNNFDEYLNTKNNFGKEAKLLIQLLGVDDFETKEKIINKIVKGDKFEIKPKNKIKKIEICHENDINLINKIKNINSNNNNIDININNINNQNNKNINIQTTNQTNNNDIENNKNKQNIITNENINLNKNEKKETKKEENIINNKISEEEPPKQVEKITPEIPKEITVLEKIENCKLKLQNQDERCITSLAILRNNRILITFKGGIVKIYEFEKNKNSPSDINNANEIQLKEILRLEEEEYCFNYGIELKNNNIAICSEDGTVKIIQLFFDEKIKNNNENYKLIQKIDEKNQDPIYIIKELENENIVLGCWKNILIYQKGQEYELLNKFFIGDYTFSILELSPNEIVASHSGTKTLTIHNLNDYEDNTIENIESNENNNIICKYDNKNDIIFVAYDKGINIISIVKKCLIKKIVLNEIISGLCPIMVHLNGGKSKNEKIFGLLCGAKRKIYNQKVNYAYSLLQLGFNINNNDLGIIDINKEIEYKEISRKDFIHYYDITNIINSIYCKNNDTLKINENKDEQWIFSSGNEDKRLKIWKF